MFIVGIKRDDSKYIDQRKKVLIALDQKYGKEVDATKWRLANFKGICDVSRAREEAEDERSFEGGGRFKNRAALRAVECFPRKMCDGIGLESIMIVLKADTIFASFIKRLALERQMDDSGSGKCGNVPTQMRENVPELIPQIAWRVLNDCLETVKDALPTDLVAKRYTGNAELGIEKAEDPLKMLSNFSHSNTYAFIHTKTNVIFLCLRTSTFQKDVSKTIGVVHDCTIWYCPAGGDHPKVFTSEVERDRNKGGQKHDINFT